MTAEPEAKVTSEEFHNRIHDNYMYGLWELAGQMTPHPMPKMTAYIWKSELFESVLKDSGEVVPIGNERRALQLFNPGLEGRWATTNSLLGAVQMLLPGETAPAHRHTPTAIRFIMEGHGAYTAVDGEKVIMEPGDLVLTPSWAWHDHGNETNDRVVWFDGLDVPLIQSLEAMFFEMYDAPRVPLSKSNNDSEHLHGHAHLAPTWVKEKPLSSPLLIYSWASAYEALISMRDQQGSPDDGIMLEYQHPQTGGTVLPTMACLPAADPSRRTPPRPPPDWQRRLLRRARPGRDDHRRRALRLGQGRRHGSAAVGAARARQHVGQRGRHPVLDSGHAGAGEAGPGQVRGLHR